MTTTDTLPVVDRFLAGLEAGHPNGDVYAPDATLDATVPGWRFQLHGVDAILDEYGRWFADPGTFHSIERHPLPDGELVRYVQDAGVGARAITVHHMHHLTIVDDKITRDVVFCGGRWAPEVVASMGAAAHAG